MATTLPAAKAASSVSHQPKIVSKPVLENAPIDPIFGKPAPIYENPEAVAETWLNHFNKAVQNVDIETIADSFTKEGIWRDLLGLEWDFHSPQGPENIQSYLKKNLAKSGLSNIELSKQEVNPVSISPQAGIEWVQAFFTFETKVGRGKGVVRLVRQEGDHAIRALSLFTSLEEVKGHEERIKSRRPLGVEHGQHAGRESFPERRAKEIAYEDHQPTVLIAGGGQAGLTISARLKMLGIDSLIIERNPRIGDNWRNRYKFLVLHDPVYYDHLPYMPFPETWPVFTPKDKLGDYFEHYAKSLELNAWTSSSVIAAVYEPDNEVWDVTVRKPDGSVARLRPRHLIQATGHSGEPNIPNFPNQEKFKGKIVHSSQHGSGAEFAGKKAIVVGCCNSGHDIAQDFYEQGADVTIYQRSSTYVMGAETGLGVSFKNLYDENGPPVEVADYLFHSIPNKIGFVLQRESARQIAELDRPVLDALAKRGFKADFGYDGSGFWGKYLRRGGGYYLDVGCSNLIADGLVKLKQGGNISGFTEDGVNFSDGTHLKADIVVLATGYKNMRTTADRIFGEGLSDKLKDVWGVDEECEINTMYRDSGHPGFWFHGGNLAMCRFFSKRLALQILAEEIGLKPRKQISA